MKEFERIKFSNSEKKKIGWRKKKTNSQNNNVVSRSSPDSLVMREVQPGSAAYKYVRKMERRYERSQEIKEFIVPIICTPLSIFFTVLSFVGRIAAYISCIGLFVGAWNLYQSFCASSAAMPVWKMDSFREGILYIILPFVAFLVSSVLNKIRSYFYIRSF